MRDRLAKLLNTTVIASKLRSHREDLGSAQAFAAKMQPLLQSAAIDTILRCIEEYGLKNNVTFEEAAMVIVTTFRELDQIWDAYILHEGLTSLHSKLKNFKSEE